jgi:hypothetical protein
VSYDDQVLSTGPVVFWHPEAGGLIDQVGSRDAAYVGSPSLVSELTGAGNALDCGGTVYAERAHESALKPAVGSVLIWVRPATVAHHWPAGCDPSGLNAGDFAFRLTDTGAAGAYFQTPSTLLVTSATSYYTAGQVMALLVTFDTSGFRVYVDGAEVGNSTGHTGGLASNTTAWVLGADRPSGPTIFNGEIDRIAIWDRVLTWDERWIVSGQEPPPEPEPSDVEWAPSWGGLLYAHGADTVEVSSAQGLQDALAAAPAGRNILVTPGTYTGGSRTMSGGGAEGNPVVIRPRDGLSSVTFSSPTWTFSGSNVVIEGMHFTGARLILRGSRIRIARNRFRAISTRCVETRGHFLRVDHNDFADMLDGNNRSAVLLDSADFANGTVDHVLIDSNYIHDMFNSASGGASEPIALGQTSFGIGSPDRDITVAHNLFHNHSQTGEGELLTLKVPHIKMIDNTITSSSLYVSFRTTHSMKYWSNWHEGNANPIVRMHGSFHDVRGNHFARNCRIGSGNATTKMQIDALPTATVFYAATSNGLFVGNTTAGGAEIRVGEFHNTPNHPAKANVFEANGNVVRSPAGTHQTDTTVESTTSHDFTRAVKLTSNDVGISARDLLD